MTLAELITSLKGTRTYDELAADGGGSPSGSRWHTLATAPLKRFPTADTIEAIRRSLDVPVSTVLFAVAESLGVRTEPMPRLAIMLPASSSRLTDRQITSVRDFIIAMTGGGDRRGEQ